MCGLCPLRGWRRRSSFAGYSVHDINAAILIRESDCRLPSWTGGVLDWRMGIRRVYIFIEIVGSVVLLDPVRNVGFPVIGHCWRWIAKTENLVWGRGRVQFALLRHLPLFPHHSLQILQEVTWGRLIGRGELLGRRESRAVRSSGWHGFPLRQRGASRLLLRRQIKRDLLSSSCFGFRRRRRFLNGHSALRLRT